MRLKKILKLYLHNKINTMEIRSHSMFVTALAFMQMLIIIL